MCKVRERERELEKKVIAFTGVLDIYLSFKTLVGSFFFFFSMKNNTLVCRDCQARFSRGALKVSLWSLGCGGCRMNEADCSSERQM